MTCCECARSTGWLSPPAPSRLAELDQEVQALAVRTVDLEAVCETTPAMVTRDLAEVRRGIERAVPNAMGPVPPSPGGASRWLSSSATFLTFTAGCHRRTHPGPGQGWWDLVDRPRRPERRASPRDPVPRLESEGRA